MLLLSVGVQVIAIACSTHCRSMPAAFHLPPGEMVGSTGMTKGLCNRLPSWESSVGVFLSPVVLILDIRLD